MSDDVPIISNLWKSFKQRQVEPLEKGKRLGTSRDIKGAHFWQPRQQLCSYSLKHLGLMKIQLTWTQIRMHVIHSETTFLKLLNVFERNSVAYHKHMRCQAAVVFSVLRRVSGSGDMREPLIKGRPSCSGRPGQMLPCEYPLHWSSLTIPRPGQHNIQFSVSWGGSMVEV